MLPFPLSPESTMIPPRDMNGRGKAFSWGASSLLLLHPTPTLSSLFLPSVEARQGLDWKAYMYHVTLVLHSYIQQGWHTWPSVPPVCSSSHRALASVPQGAGQGLPAARGKGIFREDLCPLSLLLWWPASQILPLYVFLQMTGLLRWDGRLIR